MVLHFLLLCSESRYRQRKLLLMKQTSYINWQNIENLVGMDI